MNENEEQNIDVAGEAFKHQALTNQVILENIFAFCSLQTLKQCRLVSQFWLESATKYLSALSTVKIDNSLKLSPFLALTKESRPPNPYINFWVQHSISCIPSFNVFWTSWGDKVKILELHSCSFPTVDALRQVIFRCCPYMEQLKMESVRVDDGRYVGNITEESKMMNMWPDKHLHLKCLKTNKHFFNDISWMEMFGNFPNIQAFQYVYIFCQLSMRGLVEALAAISKIRKDDPTKLLLKSVHILKTKKDGRLFTDHDLEQSVSKALKQVLLDPELTLEFLNVNVPTLVIPLLEIISTHKTTLKFFEVCSLDTSLSDFYNTFATKNESYERVLKNLQVLKLNSLVVDTLEILRFTPNLTKLSINLDIIDGALINGNYLYTDAHFQLTTCRELELISKVSPTQLENLTILLPNVEVLKMPLDNQTFSKVCQGWRKLVLLNIIHSEVDESGFTGLDIKDVELVNRKRRNFSERPITVPRANISSLNHLRKLSMKGCPLRQQSLNISTIVFGIQDSQNLSEIDVKNYKISKRLWRKRLPGVNILIETQGMITDRRRWEKFYEEKNTGGNRRFSTNCTCLIDYNVY